MTAKHCMECGEPFEAAPAPVASRPLRRLLPARVAPAVTVTLYGSQCGPHVPGVDMQSPPEAAPEAAGEVRAPNPTDAPASGSAALTASTRPPHGATAPLCQPSEIAL